MVTPPTLTATATDRAAPQPLHTARPTQTPRQIAAAPDATTPLPPPTATQWTFGIVMTPASTAAPLSPDLLTQVAIQPGGIVETTRDPARPAAPDAIPLPANARIIGYSVEGRALTLHEFGSGDRTILLVGGIHGGYEANTVELVNQLIAHFAANPGDIVPGLRLALIPVANPDGLARGRAAEGRFNGSGVDLNRNWGCDWSAEAVWRDRAVNPGNRAFSEPEARAIADLFGELRPRIALFYHSAANGVFAGTCGGNHSAVMSAVLGEATGYNYGQPFSAYPVTGTAASWANSLGVASADVELESRTDSEFERNLRGVMTLQRWLLEQR